jgi:hypothetical protein
MKHMRHASKTAETFGARIEKRGRGSGCLADARRRRRRHRGEAGEDEVGDATPGLLLKHVDKTFATYIRRKMKHLKHASETLIEELETLEKLLQSIYNIKIKYLQCLKYMQHTSKKTNEAFGTDTCNIRV